jgi:hypothetical protein
MKRARRIVTVVAAVGALWVVAGAPLYQGL